MSYPNHFLAVLLPSDHDFDVLAGKYALGIESLQGGLLMS